MAAAACLGLLAEPVSAALEARRPVSVLALAAGGAMMLHDWKDRSMWFERGWGTQP